MERSHDDDVRTFTCMSETLRHDDGSSGPLDFYVPGTAVASDRTGRIERFLTSLYRVHRFRGGVTARTE